MTRPPFRSAHARCAIQALSLATVLMSSALVHAQSGAGTPPPDATALVAAPAPSVAPPKLDRPPEGTVALLSAGGQFSTGNSEVIAATVNGNVERRWESDALGFSLLGNYARSAQRTTAQNLQGRLRYDRFLIERASLFLINTGRHDRFQGLSVRYNLDPGLKYLFLNSDANAVWAELGYDFQYDVRRDDARVTMTPNVLLDKTDSDHSLRLFAGCRHAFNDHVLLTTGIEYLQSFVEGKKSRLNYDLLVSAKIGAGFALGVGFGARYDHDPLPGKKHLDTATTVSLIYSLDTTVAAAPPPAPAPVPAPG